MEFEDIIHGLFTMYSTNIDGVQVMCERDFEKACNHFFDLIYESTYRVVKKDSEEE